MSTQAITVYSVLEQYLGLFEVQEAVNEVSLEREGLHTVSLIQLRIDTRLGETIKLRLREVNAGHGYTLEQRSQSGWDRWHGIDTFGSQTAGGSELFKVAVEKSGFDADSLPELHPGPTSAPDTTQGGTPV